MNRERGRRRYQPERSWSGDRRAPNGRNDAFATFFRGLLAVIGGGILMVIFFALIGLILALVSR